MARNSNSCNRLRGDGPLQANPRPARRARPSARARVHAVSLARKFDVMQIDARRPIIFLASGKGIESRSEMFSEIARRTHVSITTVYRWYQRFLQFGLRGLRDKRRSDRGVSRVLRDRQLAAVFISAKRERGLSIAAVHRALAERWPSLYSDRRVVSYNSVRRFLAKTEKRDRQVRR